MLKKPKKVRAPETPRHTYNKKALCVGNPSPGVGQELAAILERYHLQTFWKDAVTNILIHDVLYDEDMVLDGSLFQYAEDTFYELCRDGTLVGVPDNLIP